jgi:hypothetical protein
MAITIEEALKAKKEGEESLPQPEPDAVGQERPKISSNDSINKTLTKIQEGIGNYLNQYNKTLQGFAKQATLVVKRQNQQLASIETVLGKTKTAFKDLQDRFRKLDSRLRQIESFKPPPPIVRYKPKPKKKPISKAVAIAGGLGIASLAAYWLLKNKDKDKKPDTQADAAKVKPKSEIKWEGKHAILESKTNILLDAINDIMFTAGDKLHFKADEIILDSDDITFATTGITDPTSSDTVAIKIGGETTCNFECGAGDSKSIEDASPWEKGVNAAEGEGGGGAGDGSGLIPTMPDTIPELPGGGPAFGGPGGFDATNPFFGVPADPTSLITHGEGTFGSGGSGASGSWGDGPSSSTTSSSSSTSSTSTSISPLTPTEPEAGGSAYLASKRTDVMKTLDTDPQLRNTVARLLASENRAGRTAVLESMVNRVLYLREHGQPNLTLKDHIYGGFYGPINRNELVGINQKDIEETNKAISRVKGGSNITDLRTDQGMWQPGHYEHPYAKSHGPEKARLKNIDGEWYSDWNPTAQGWSNRERDKMKAYDDKKAKEDAEKKSKEDTKPPDTPQADASTVAKPAADSSAAKSQATDMFAIKGGGEVLSDAPPVGGAGSQLASLTTTPPTATAQPAPDVIATPTEKGTFNPAPSGIESLLRGLFGRPREPELPPIKTEPKGVPAIQGDNKDQKAAKKIVETLGPEKMAKLPNDVKEHIKKALEGTGKFDGNFVMQRTAPLLSKTEFAQLKQELKDEGIAINDQATSVAPVPAADPSKPPNQTQADTTQQPPVAPDATPVDPNKPPTQSIVPDKPPEQTKPEEPKKDEPKPAEEPKKEEPQQAGPATSDPEREHAQPQAGSYGGGKKGVDHNSGICMI